MCKYWRIEITSATMNSIFWRLMKITCKFGWRWEQFKNLHADDEPNSTQKQYAGKQPAKRGDRLVNQQLHIHLSNSVNINC